MPPRPIRPEHPLVGVTANDTLHNVAAVLNYLLQTSAAENRLDEDALAGLQLIHRAIAQTVQFELARQQATSRPAGNDRT